MLTSKILLRGYFSCKQSMASVRPFIWAVLGSCGALVCIVVLGLQLSASRSKAWEREQVLEWQKGQFELVQVSQDIVSDEGFKAALGASQMDTVSLMVQRQRDRFPQYLWGVFHSDCRNVFSAPEFSSLGQARGLSDHCVTDMLEGKQTLQVERRSYDRLALSFVQKLTLSEGSASSVYLIVQNPSVAVPFGWEWRQQSSNSSKLYPEYGIGPWVAYPTSLWTHFLLKFQPVHSSNAGLFLLALFAVASVLVGFWYLREDWVMSQAENKEWFNLLKSQGETIHGLKASELKHSRSVESLRESVKHLEDLSQASEGLSLESQTNEIDLKFLEDILEFQNEMVLKTSSILNESEALVKFLGPHLQQQENSSGNGPAFMDSWVNLRDQLGKALSLSEKIRVTNAMYQYKAEEHSSDQYGRDWHGFVQMIVSMIVQRYEGIARVDWFGGPIRDVFGGQIDVPQLDTMLVNEHQHPNSLVENNSDAFLDNPIQKMSSLWIHLKDALDVLVRISESPIQILFQRQSFLEMKRENPHEKLIWLKIVMPEYWNLSVQSESRLNDVASLVQQIGFKTIWVSPDEEGKGFEWQWHFKPENVLSLNQNLDCSSSTNESKIELSALVQ